jgi:hypothetical protein
MGAGAPKAESPDERHSAGVVGLGDLGTWGLGDLGTWGLGDLGTWGLGDLGRMAFTTFVVDGGYHICNGEFRWKDRTFLRPSGR